MPRKTRPVTDEFLVAAARPPGVHGTWWKYVCIASARGVPLAHQLTDNYEPYFVKTQAFCYSVSIMLTSHRQKKLEKYVKKYFQRHPEVKLVTVAGSTGKTYAKKAIASILSSRLRVRLHDSNRTGGFEPPLAILGIDFPGEIRGWGAWHRIYKAARLRIKQPSDVDVIVHELNSYGPGSLRVYNQYIVPDITVITSVTETGVDQFQTIDMIASEQLSAASMSKLALINRDDIEGRFSSYLTTPSIYTYGTGAAAEYRFEESDFTIQDGYSGSFIARDWQEPVPLKLRAFDDFSVRLVVAAAAVGVQLGLSPQDIQAGVSTIRPVPGRMNALRGVEQSTILDDTANNSPLGSRIALQALYQIPAPQRIAVFGDMQHLGQFSETAHRELGLLCDPAELAWVVTVGDAANTWLAPAARGRGCQVKQCKNAIEAGSFVHSLIESGAVSLFSGPERDVYLEEAVKIVLHDTSEEKTMLVRQSTEWLAKKNEAFSRFSR